jgi:hypothetical protein
VKSDSIHFSVLLGSKLCFDIGNYSPEVVNLVSSALCDPFGLDDKSVGSDGWKNESRLTRLKARNGTHSTLFSRSSCAVPYLTC